MSDYSSDREVYGTGALTAAIIIGSIVVMLVAFVSFATNTTTAATPVHVATTANEEVVVSAPRLHKDS